MPSGRQQTCHVVALNVAEKRSRRSWLTAVMIGTFFLGYYYFVEAWPALFGAGSG
jgi:hypothetical protein